MSLVEKVVAMVALLALGVLTVWLQLNVIEPTEAVVEEADRHDPDYYIENFTAVGMDDDGRRKYLLEAERMVHYPDDDTALLDNPHLIQYAPGEAPRHTYAESGWVGPSGDEVFLSGSVRVIQGEGNDTGGGVITTEKMRVKLK